MEAVPVWFHVQLLQGVSQQALPVVHFYSLDDSGSSFEVLFGGTMKSLAKHMTISVLLLGFQFEQN